MGLLTVVFLPPWQGTSSSTAARAAGFAVACGTAGQQLTGHGILHD